MSQCHIFGHDADDKFVCQRCAEWVGPQRELEPWQELLLYATFFAGALLLVCVLSRTLWTILRLFAGVFGFEFQGAQ